MVPSETYERTTHNHHTIDLIYLEGRAFDAQPARSQCGWLIVGFCWTDRRCAVFTSWIWILTANL